MSSACGVVSFTLECRGLYVAVLLFKSLSVGDQGVSFLAFAVDCIGQQLDDTTMGVKHLLMIKTIILPILQSRKHCNPLP